MDCHQIVKMCKNHVKESVDVDKATEALRLMSAKELQRRALSNVGSLGLAAGGGAAALGGLVGLSNLLRSNFVAPRRSVPDPVVIPTKRDKQSAAAAPPSFWKGDKATTIGGIPWYLPALFASGALGTYVGAKGSDKVNDWMRDSDVDHELESAKQEYENALSSATTQKISSDVEMKRALDEIFDLCHKEASATDPNNMLGMGTGIYGLYAGVTGLAAAVAAAKWAKKRQKKRIVEEAQKMRIRERANRRPEPIFATSAPGGSTPGQTNDDATSVKDTLDL